MIMSTGKRPNRTPQRPAQPAPPDPPLERLEPRGHNRPERKFGPYPGRIEVAVWLNTAEVFQP